MITTRSLRASAVIATFAVLVGACSGAAEPTTTTTEAAAVDDAAVADDLRRVATPAADQLDLEAVERLGASGDERVAWLLADVLRFVPVPTTASAVLSDAIAEATGLDLAEDDPATWVVTMNHLITEDVPAPPGYPDLKATVYGQVDSLWAFFLRDPTNTMDPRLVAWGGVRPDQRPLDSDVACAGCIPALDHPAVTDAAGGEWLQDQRVVFGVVVDGEARAYPRHQMEVHELVNDTLGGREIAVPYCTLCGAAHAYFVDDVEGYERLVLRTSGLLHRSNKVMWERSTRSFFDTFAGVGVSGPLVNVELTEVPVVTSTWGAWKEAHPDTTILAEDGGVGRTYQDDPLQGRDAGGPIFPVGPIDSRLGSVDRVVTATTPDGVPVAFPVAGAEDGAELAGVRLVADGSGYRVETAAGEPLPSHEAYWFAWSQFHPDTELWVP